MRKVAVIMGSPRDLDLVKPGLEQLKELSVPFSVHVLSAHRSPAQVATFAQSARSSGYGVLIGAAGMAAHLAGALAAHSSLPVIGLPLVSGALGGMDALLSTVQMPPGIPVATVGVNAAKNAALLAAQILALQDDALTERLAENRRHTNNANKELGDQISSDYNFEGGDR